MTTEQNKAVVQRFHDLFNAGDLDGCETLFAPDAEVYVPGMPDPLTVPAFKQFGAAYRAAFPAGKTLVESAIAEGDQVAERGTYRGVQQGAFMGIPATGREVNITWTGFTRVVNGKIVYHRVDQDNLGMMQQLGVIPAQA